MEKCPKCNKKTLRRYTRVLSRFTMDYRGYKIGDPCAIKVYWRCQRGVCACHYYYEGKVGVAI